MITSDICYCDYFLITSDVCYCDYFLITTDSKRNGPCEQLTHNIQRGKEKAEVFCCCCCFVVFFCRFFFLPAYLVSVHYAPSVVFM